MSTNLTEVLFSNCDLYQEFEKQLPTKPTLKRAITISIDPTKTKVKKAQFSIEGLKGLQQSTTLLSNKIL
jgi:hypothetical protein